MGGVGKTQLAAHHARRALQAGQIDLLVWVTATTRSAIIDTYAHAAVTILDADPANPQAAATAFLAWLEPKASPAPAPASTTGQGTPGNPRWLVVLDDLTDPADLRGLRPPTSPRGRTLVTTRRRDAALTGRTCQQVSVDLFTPKEATNYLAEALTAHERHEPAEQLTALARDLGHLPLALSQAAAYIVDTGLACTDYRQLLADRTTTLAQALPDAAVLPDDQTTTTAAAWSLSMDRADRFRPAGYALPMLQLASVLDPNGIPQSVLTSPPALQHLAARRTPHHDPADSQTTPQTAIAALQALRRLSLIEYAPDNDHQTVRIHQLIQRTVRDTLPNDQLGEVGRAAADALIAAWPSVERDRDLAQALRANTGSLTHHAGEALWRPHAHPVVDRFGQSVGESGQTREAVAHFQDVVNNSELRLGRDHPGTLAARDNLAYWRGKSGDAVGAFAALAELVTDYVRVFGPDHLDTLRVRGSLARWQGEAGDMEGSVAALTDLVADRTRLQGPDHPDTLSTRNDLARTLPGREGLAAWAEVLTDRIRVLGPDHPDTLETRQDLAFWRGAETEDAASAAAALADLYEDYVRVLGPDHPRTLSAGSSFAFWQGTAGDASGAAGTLADLLEHHVRVMGPDHPDTFSTRRNLAHWLGQAGDAASAIALWTEVLEDQEREPVLDRDDTLMAFKNLIVLRTKAGDRAGVVEAQAGLLAEEMRRLGPDHPDTLSTRWHLAYARGEAGDTARACAEFSDLVDSQVRVLGPDHTETLRTRRELARWRGEGGDAAAAAAAMADLLDDYMRVLGPDHAEALRTRRELAQWWGEGGDAAAAAGPGPSRHPLRPGTSRLLPRHGRRRSRRSHRLHRTAGGLPADPGTRPPRHSHNAPGLRPLARHRRQRTRRCHHLRRAVANLPSCPGPRPPPHP
ncbi:tetratricopeptide repeat protein [Streptomyces sp. MB09-01]|uniref:tetratricopeptide repeat protein n=1 Tax=Streptomyces sp. MB09-01 TaxID=3028666 RepID=UPI0029B9D29F|nr:tetratricopeptide repeat protein [Streptomyces sp. MB09-01]MDX3535622.1 tetratricopeptide repeat protein [Streptomyces sp. MB09-01]